MGNNDKQESCLDRDIITRHINECIHCWRSGGMGDEPHKICMTTRLLASHIKMFNSM